MGEVFRADDLMLDEPVAIKLLPRSAQKYHEHLRNEVRMARLVTHENVCRVFDFGEADGETYLTMEYVDGENLASLLGRIGRCSKTNCSTSPIKWPVDSPRPTPRGSCTAT